MAAIQCLERLRKTVVGNGERARHLRLVTQRHGRTRTILLWRREDSRKSQMPMDDRKEQPRRIKEEKATMKQNG